MLYSQRMRCPHCNRLKKTEPWQRNRTNILKFGSFYRSSDSKLIQRFRCSRCQQTFSLATFDPAYWQKKRRVNTPLARLLSSAVSMRRSAKILKVAKKTVERKLRYLALIAREEHQKYLSQLDPIKLIQLDELQTIEHTKCKPLSVAMCISAENRKILSFEVSRMPATGHLAKIALKKYGFRADNRRAGLKKALQEVKPLVGKSTQILSDEHPYYHQLIRKYLGRINHQTVKGAKSCIAGQGELKKLKYDPLFSINHTFAMLRANINRLIRKTWCTTKDPARLADHLAIYTLMHNQVLT